LDVAKLSSKAQNLVGRVVGRAHSSLYRTTDGRFGGKMFGAPVLLLNTTGRKSGQRRTTPLLYLRDGEDLAIVASNGGAPRHPAWFLNLKANPEATVELGDREVRVRAEEASPEEKARLWPRLVEMYPGYEGYQEKTDREIPVVVLHPIG
jgi:deazaflavin-dependent oxidoreductase (nitroreductase family)